jgi:asparagine synthase (glutamine-hydrolysing)
VGLAHRRLAIIDLSEGGAQPMATPDGQIVITFNGEIYNYKELRKELSSRGCVFRSNSDTEVLLHLYREYGPTFVKRIRGMFAFAIWDDRSQSLFLARDQFGIKPLYWNDDGYVFRFASQVKALLNSANVDRRIEPAGHVGFFLWGFVPEPYTLYHSIRSLPAGTTLTIRRDGTKHADCYFDIPARMAAAKESIDKGGALEALAHAVDTSISYHMVADVPVGLFLSAGIDSSVVAASAVRHAANRIQAITLGFSRYKGTEQDEVPLATDFAGTLALNHSVSWTEFEDFSRLSEEFFHRMDQPSIDGLNTYLVSRAAASAGMKVAMSGLGADELFGGYPSFKDIPRSVRQFGAISRSRVLAKSVRMVASHFVPLVASPKFAGVLEYGGSFPGAYLLRRGLFMPWELPEVLDAEIVEQGLAELQTLLRLRESVCDGLSDFQKVSALEMSWYMRNQLLRDSDWAGMAHSVEIRVPFIDVQLLDVASSLASDGLLPGKAVLARACLPSAIAHTHAARQKTGFTVPIVEWSKTFAPSSKGSGMRAWAKVVYSRLFPRSATQAQKRIAIFRIGNLGDSLVSMPAVKAIREQNQDAALVLIANQGDRRMVSTSDVLAPTGWIDHQVAYRSEGGTLARLSSLFSLVRRLRALKLDTIYYLPPSRSRWQRLRDRYLLKFAAGIRDFAESDPAQRPVARPGMPLPVLRPEWSRLATICPQQSREPFRLPIPFCDRCKADEVLRRAGIIDTDTLIALGPGSKMPAKVWPYERFRDVAKSLLESFSGVKLLVLGGPEDSQLATRLAGELPPGRVAALAGNLSIYASAAALKRCTLYVGNDTGTMHLAAMVGVRCVAIFSARDKPGTWEPYGDGHVILRKDIECAGCMLEICSAKRNECLTRISVNEVASACMNALHNNDVHYDAPPEHRARHTSAI